MRLRKLISKLKKEGKLPYLISSLPNINYLTGFKGSFAYLLLGDGQGYFISDSRYREYAEKIIPPGLVYFPLSESLGKTVGLILKELGAGQLFLEEHSIPLSVYHLLGRELKKVKIRAGGDAVNDLRIVKDDDEITTLKQAAKITDRCMEHLTEFIRPGVSEWDVSNEIELFYRNSGCRRTSFYAIVASGSGSSMPHYETSMTKKISAGDPVLVDMGCHYLGYNSDLTRTVFVGSVDERIRHIYEVVREAQASAVAAVKPGITAGKLDKIARDVIEKHGYGEYFGHGLGHGLGLDVHEMPSIRTGSAYRLKKNTVITIEPGIYIPGYGGVRIEDMVLVTDNGHEVLTKFTKDILVL